MASNWIIRAGRLAVGLAVVGSLAALVSEALSFRRSGLVDWGHVALALGVPFLMYGIVRGGSKQQP